MSTWNEKMTERLDELRQKIEAEENNLSAFRRIEAPYLALTKEEIAELRELRWILRCVEEKSIA